MAEYLPESIMYAVGEMKEVSRNQFKIFTVSADTASAGKIVNFVLPENCLIDTRSVKMFMDVTCQGKIDAAVPPVPGNDVFAKLPNYSSTLISRMEIYANGVQLSAGSSLYGTIAQVLRLSESNINKDNSVDRCLQHSYITGDDADDDETLCVNEWVGFLGQGSTRYLNLGLIGSVSIRLTYAPNSVLVPKQRGQDVGDPFTNTNALQNAQQISYQVSNMYFTCDTISLDPLYNDLLKERLEQGGLAYNYPELYSFSLDGIQGNTTNGAAQLRFALSSGCITKCYGTYQDANANGVVGVPAHTLPNAAGVASEVANCLRFRSYSGQTKKAGAANWEWTVNNVKYPQFRSSWINGLANLAYSQDKVEQDNSGTLVTSTESYNDGKFVFPLMLEMPTGRGVSVMSSFNSRGINSQMVYAGSALTIPAASVSPDLNNSGIATCFVVASTVAQLRIQLGRDLLVVY
jgi:hypothetical protein